VKKKRGVLRWVVLGLVLVTCAVLALWSLVRHDQRAAIGEELLYDDFGFRVRSVRTLEDVGDTDARLQAGAGQSFVVVRFEVENHARRVDYDMSNHRAVLEDETGRTFEVDADATRALAENTHALSTPARIRAGDFTSSDLVFRVPAAVSALRLRVKWKTEPFDGIDQTVFGDRAIVLGR